MNTVLTLADLQNFDPWAPQREGERRFLCPLCGEDKPKNAAHRCFCLNSSNGLYHCKRCNSKGRLKDFWEDKSNAKSRAIVDQQWRRAFDLVPVAHNGKVEVEEVRNDSETANVKANWRILWESAEVLSRVGRHELALRYLKKRGISFGVACDNEVRFVANWYGRPTLGFPFKSSCGEVVAVAGRALSDGGLDKPASGPKKEGAFWSNALGYGPLDSVLPAVILCEAPFDALTLSMAGYPSLALGGTNPPTWLHQKCAFRRVLLAFDADAAGDAAADKIGMTLSSFGAVCQRLRPTGAKDWNDLLQKEGVQAIESIISPIISQL